MLTMVSWNSDRSPNALETATADNPDVVLLQEAVQTPVPAGYRQVGPTLDSQWRTGGHLNRAWSTSIAVRDTISASAIELAPIDDARIDQLGVSRAGSLTAATIGLADEDPITIVCVYSAWENPLDQSSWIYADASAHRLISDISALVSTQRGHRVIVAGDWNILRGYGENGSSYWRDRYKTVFDRLAAIGLDLIGPVAGRRPETLPNEMPADSTTTPTFWPKNGEPTRQLDFVFASTSLTPRMTTEALNDPKDWVRDHCQIRITLDAKPTTSG